MIHANTDSKQTPKFNATKTIAQLGGDFKKLPVLAREKLLAAKAYESGNTEKMEKHAREVCKCLANKKDFEHAVLWALAIGAKEEAVAFAKEGCYRIIEDHVTHFPKRSELKEMMGLVGITKQDLDAGRIKSIGLEAVRHYINSGDYYQAESSAHNTGVTDDELEAIVFDASVERMKEGKFIFASNDMQHFLGPEYRALRPFVLKAITAVLESKRALTAGEKSALLSGEKNLPPALAKDIDGIAFSMLEDESSWGFPGLGLAIAKTYLPEARAREMLIELMATHDDTFQAARSGLSHDFRITSDDIRAWTAGNLRGKLIEHAAGDIYWYVSLAEKYRMELETNLAKALGQAVLIGKDIFLFDKD